MYTEDSFMPEGHFNALWDHTDLRMVYVKIGGMYSKAVCL